jgi:ABC-type thiamin/hydroxymethylpyrimidine transport system permease subunit
MIYQVLDIPAVAFLGITSLLMIFFWDQRIRLFLLAGIYLGEFFLISLSWPVSLSVSKLISGWIACAVLGMAVSSNPPLPTTGRNQKLRTTPPLLRFLNIPPSTIFYLLSAVLVDLLAISASVIVKAWLPGILDEQIWAGFILIGMGIIQLSFRTDAFSIIVGLLTTLAGFEIIYVTIEGSILVAALLAAITLGLALVGAYLILSPNIVEDE